MLGGSSKIDGLIVSSRYGRTARDAEVKVEKAGYTVGDGWFDCMYRCDRTHDGLTDCMFAFGTLCSCSSPSCSAWCVSLSAGFTSINPSYIHAVIVATNKNAQ